MEVMSDAAKKDLYDLVDALPSSEVQAARRYLEFLKMQASDPYAYLDETDPFDDMPEEERERLHAVLAQSEKELAEGKGIPAEVVLQKLRSKR